jgi:hypothetical protein
VCFVEKKKIYILKTSFFSCILNITGCMREKKKEKERNHKVRKIEIICNFERKLNDKSSSYQRHFEVHFWIIA